MRENREFFDRIYRIYRMKEKISRSGESQWLHFWEISIRLRN